MAREAARLLPSALTALRGPREQLAGKTLLFALDYDGTLTDIVSDPASATLPPRTRETLQALEEAHPGRVAILTGRGYDKITAPSFVGLGSLTYAASHGYDIVGPRLKLAVADDFLPDLAAAG
jgi:trehalose-phosphatase